MQELRNRMSAKTWMHIIQAVSAITPCHGDSFCQWCPWNKRSCKTRKEKFIVKAFLLNWGLQSLKIWLCECLFQNDHAKMCMLTPTPIEILALHLHIIWPTSCGDHLSRSLNAADSSQFWFCAHFLLSPWNLHFRLFGNEFQRNMRSVQGSGSWPTRTSFWLDSFNSNFVIPSRVNLGHPLLQSSTCHHP